MVQNFPSSQGSPSFLGSDTQAPAWHWPSEQASGPLPSSQKPPSLMGMGEQPCPWTQTPAVHWLSKIEQLTGLPFMHCPPEQTPCVVQGSRSSHCAPSLPGIVVQVFEASSQAPRWHASPGGQNLALPPVQWPLMQMSFSVQNCPSSQAPFSLAGPLRHVPLMQVPTLHTSPRATQSSALTQDPGGPSGPPSGAAPPSPPVPVVAPPPAPVEPVSTPAAQAPARETGSRVTRAVAAG